MSTTRRQRAHSSPSSSRSSSRSSRSSKRQGGVETHRSAAVDATRWDETPAVQGAALRLRDVLDMRPGATLRVLPLHRNLLDIPLQEAQNPQGVATPPARFFRSEVATYRHVGPGPIGEMHWAWQPATTWEPFEFEVEYAPDRWYPLKDGALPHRDPQGFAHLGAMGGKSWRAMPPSTRVGWRGAMVPWASLRSAPRVVW